MAHDLRQPGIATREDAQRTIEERRASAPAQVGELLEEAASAVRDRAIDD